MFIGMLIKNKIKIKFRELDHLTEILAIVTSVENLTRKV